MDWLEWGYLGLFLGTLVAATILPLTSEGLLIGMLIAGANPVFATVVAIAGNWSGGMITYGLGRLGKIEWIEKYLRVSHEKVLKFESKVRRFRSWIALFTWLPIIGDPMSIALGLFKLPWIPVAFFSLVGRAVRFTVVTLIYFYADQKVF